MERKRKEKSLGVVVHVEGLCCVTRTLKQRQSGKAPLSG